RLALEPKPDFGGGRWFVIAEDAKIKKTFAVEIRAEAGARLQRSPLGHQNPSFSGQSARPFLPPSRPVSDAGPERPSNQRCRHLGYQPFVQRRLSNGGLHPQFLDHHSFYLSLDVNFLLDLFRTDVAYLKSTWSAVGRPLFVIPVYHWKLQSGYINGTRVTLGNLADFVDTSCVTQMSFLNSSQERRAAVRRRPGPQRRTSRPCSAAAAAASVRSLRPHSRTFGSSESSPEDQCSVRIVLDVNRRSSAAASAAAAATASRRRKSLVLSNAVSERARRRSGRHGRRLRPRFVRHPWLGAAAAAAATSSFDEDRQHSVDHTRLRWRWPNPATELRVRGLRINQTDRVFGEPSSRTARSCCEGKLDNSSNRGPPAPSRTCPLSLTAGFGWGVPGRQDSSRLRKVTDAGVLTPGAAVYPEHAGSHLSRSYSPAT
uniref:Phosphorylase b kinase regulatory subunit n=1 Tax=Macrostomum lignano TaxID=282301 RepID=A0A1I8F8A0_9PLAT